MLEMFLDRINRIERSGSMKKKIMFGRGVPLRMPTRVAIQSDGHRLRLIYGRWDARTRT